jgi:hypothetical protein
MVGPKASWGSCYARFKIRTCHLLDRCAWSPRPCACYARARLGHACGWPLARARAVLGLAASSCSRVELQHLASSRRATPPPAVVPRDVAARTCATPLPLRRVRSTIPHCVSAPIVGPSRCQSLRRARGHAAIALLLMALRPPTLARSPGPPRSAAWAQVPLQ